MDQDRFDSIARDFASTSSRRKIMGRIGAAGMLAIVGRVFGRPRGADAHHCDYIGCGCATGTLHPCGSGLVCCPSNPGLPGGAGVCAPAGQCGGSCVGFGNACPAYCNWGDTCPDCCSGFCGTYGACA